MLALAGSSPGNLFSNAISLNQSRVILFRGNDDDDDADADADYNGPQKTKLVLRSSLRPIRPRPASGGHHRLPASVARLMLRSGTCDGCRGAIESKS